MKTNWIALITLTLLTSCAKPPTHLRWQEAPNYTSDWLGSLNGGEIRNALREGPVFMTLSQNALRNLLPFEKSPYGGSTFLVEHASRDRLGVKRMFSGIHQDGMPSIDHHEFSIAYLRQFQPQFYRTQQIAGKNHTFKQQRQ